MLKYKNGGVFMNNERKNRGLKNRVAMSNAVNRELWTRLQELSSKTKVTVSRLLDEAIEDLLKKRE